MKITMQVYLKNYKNKINRTIEVSSDLDMSLFCEYIIISMNGNCKHLYQLIVNDIKTYLSSDCAIYEDTEEYMDGKTIDYLRLKLGDKLLLNYDFAVDWEFIIKILNIEDENCDEKFKVTSANGCGIIENIIDLDIFRRVQNFQKEDEIKKLSSSIYGEIKDYTFQKVCMDELNLKINDYLEKNQKKNKPKNYKMSVSLEGYGSLINRKIVVDSNLNLDDFCRCIVYSMKGDLSHCYGIKIGKEFLDNDEIKNKDLNSLELQKLQKFFVVYDFGDNWQFKISVSKITDGYGAKRFQVISGKGYGIVDDCGGVYELCNIFEGRNKDWGTYDINSFDLEAINRTIDIYL